MISGCLCNCGSPRTSHAWQNMDALKKYFEFYTSSFAKVRALIAGQNPFSQRKNLPNTGETQVVPTGAIHEKIDGLVTTSHLFWPSYPSKAGLLLPSWLRNFHFSPGQRQQGGGGARQRGPRKKPRSKRALRIFCLMNPPPCSAAAKKKTASADAGGGM